MKKEFITSWTTEDVHAKVTKMPIDQQRFFDCSEGINKAILPDNIPFNELMVFAGQRTKITIEVIPW